MKVILDRQHEGKPAPDDRDRGAVFADGTTEAAHSMAYINAAKPLLEAAGVQVVVLVNGTYAERNKAANAMKATLYVACHVNAGATDPARVYALTEYASDHGIPAESQRAATVLLESAARVLKERAVGPKALRSGERGHVCVAACTMPAVIFEPEFTVAARSDALVGASLAEGICRYLGVSWPPAPTPPTNPIHVGTPLEIDMNLTPVDITIGPLDDNGRGNITVPVLTTKIVSVVPMGIRPNADGRYLTPDFAVAEEGQATVVSVEEWDPKGTVHARLWVAG